MSAWVPSLVGAAFGLFSGLFGRALEFWWNRPKLVIDFDWKQGGFRTEGTWKDGEVDIVEIYVRARIRNDGRHVAKRCSAYLTKLEEVHPSGTTPTTFFDSLALRWPGGSHEPREIPPDINQFVDIVGVLKNRPGWRFTFRERFSGHAELPNYKGTYRFTILVTGDGVKPVSRQIDVTYNGDWHSLRAVPHD